jgi:hypothetical protein
MPVLCASLHHFSFIFFHFFFIFQKYFDGIVAHNSYCIINATMSNNQEDDNEASQKVDSSQLSIAQAFARVIPQCSNKKKRSRSLPSRTTAKKVKSVSLYVFK